MMQIVGPTCTAMPYARPLPAGGWICRMKGGGPLGFGESAPDAYRHWRAKMLRHHKQRYAHDPNHKLYFPGDPEWKWETLS